MNSISSLDPGAAVLQRTHGEVILAPGLQGRIFAELDGVLLHRLDAAAARRSATEEEFRNIGGNSLWPAPEGGAYAFNYLPENPEKWLVQPGVNTQVATLTAAGADGLACRKNVALRNRNGADFTAEFSRQIQGFEVEFPAGTAIGYRAVDTITPTVPQALTAAPVAAWSLEQFPGCAGVIAFGRVAEGDARAAINADFYGDPWPRLRFDGGAFTFALGGAARLQIGINAAARPEFIGALDLARGLLIVRVAEAGTGKRLNIADNAQPNGVFSATDMYSIFNGGELDFFELEAIAPMTLDDEMRVVKSRLIVESRCYRGEKNALLKLLREQYRIHMEV